MKEKLNQLLKGQYEILYIDKWNLPDNKNADGFFNMIIRSDSNVCKLTICDFEVTRIEGSMLVSGIERINNALSGLKEMEAAA